MTKENERLQALAKEFFNYTVEENPIFATYLGLHQYDHLMPDESKLSIIKDLEKAKSFLSKFENIDPTKLNKDNIVDRELAIHVLKLGIWAIENLRFWEKDPDVAEGIGDALFPLFTRDFAPFEKRLENIAERLSQTERIVIQTKERVTKPVKIYTKIAMEACGTLPSFLDEIVTEAKKRSVNPKLLDRLTREVIKTKILVTEYKNYLLTLERGADENFAIGTDRMKKLIELRELGMPLDKILTLGENYLREFKHEQEKLIKKIDPKAKSVKEVSKKIKSHRPKSFEEALQFYIESAKRARDFVVKNDIATVPSQSLKIMATPVYMRHTIPAAAYFSPPKFEEATLGIYIVTPPADEEDFQRLAFADIANTTVHEAYPGHHLQLSCSKANPSLIRIFPDATEFVEGWAHYCEEMMKEKGYDDTPEARFVMLEDMVWRACRIIVDIKLHCGLMKFDEAVEFLIKNANMSKAMALGEVKRYTQSPGYQLSYLYGKHMIKQMRESCKKKMGDRYNDKFFHDVLLNAGSLPIAYMKKVLDNAIAKELSHQ
jgi:uncharacterized protein (DUF885 family)